MAATGRSAVLGLTSLRASAPSPDANLDLPLSATYNGTPFTLAGEFGPLTRLQDRQASALAGAGASGGRWSEARRWTAPSRSRWRAADIG